MLRRELYPVLRQPRRGVCVTQPGAQPRHAPTPGSGPSATRDLVLRGRFAIPRGSSNPTRRRGWGGKASKVSQHARRVARP